MSALGQAGARAFEMYAIDEPKPVEGTKSTTVSHTVNGNTIAMTL
jgi:hypothetical protein